MSLSHKYINLKQLYNQDTKEHITTKSFFEKKTGFKMYYVLFTKILQGGDTASGIGLHKRCSRICG